MDLITAPHLDTPEHFYEALIDAHRDLAPADSHVLNVRPGEVALMPRGLVQGGLARWPLARLKYDTANFMTIGSISFDQLQSPRSVDLHRTHQRERHPGNGELRFRDLPAATASYRPPMRCIAARSTRLAPTAGKASKTISRKPRREAPSCLSDETQLESYFPLDDATRVACERLAAQSA